MQLRLARRHWAIVAATAALAVGGCAMAWSWGTWGVFVACAALTLDPAYTVGWVFPGKSGVGARVVDEDDAWWIGWLVLGLGLFCTVTVIAVEIIPRIRRARRES